MDTRLLQQLIAWAKGTDLVELSWKSASDRVEFRLEQLGPAPAPFPASPLVPVSSPTVGLFRWGAPGAPRAAQEGKAVAAGELLGLVETAGEPAEVRAPAAGRLLKILVEEGKAVEYGQGLFLIAP